MRFAKKHLLYFLTVFFLMAAASPSMTASAASRPASITSCQLSSANKVKVSVSVSNTKKIKGKKCYLFALSFSDSGLGGARPIASKKKGKKMTFSVTLNNATASSLLYSRFVVASKSNGVYKIVSNARYISNPKKAAKYKYKFPTAASKKGLQVSSNMLEDAIDLNIQHSAMNIVFSELISSAPECNNTFSIPYNYHGKTYWFRKALVNNYDAQLVALRENNVTVSAILLLGWRDDLKSLIYPSGRTAGHSFYAWNTANATAREQLQATLSFLGSRYGTSSAEHGRIVNWIVGNEVNNYNVYNYAGSLSLKQYAKVYADAFRMTYNTVTSIYSNARVYISLDHLWNTRVSGSFTSREMLEKFASTLKKQGNINWNLAFHPYGSPLTEPRFWADVNGQARQALSTPVISMKNISVLTSFIKKNYGSKTRIILSEQGYTSVRHYGSSKSDAQRDQEAAIAYSYYLTEANSMIDSFIMNRHVDHQVEVDQGLDLGLWTTDPSSNLPEWADTKKSSWNVFKYMDTNKAKSVTKNALAAIGVKKWSKVVSKYSKKLYQKYTFASAALNQVGSYRGTASLATGWNAYGAVSSGAAAAGGVTAQHNSSRNRNSLWGFSQNFGKKVNFNSSPCFYTTLQVHGAAAGSVQVTVRFYNGKHILESSRVIPCDTPVNLGVSLKKWKYRKSVKKIQVLLSPVSGGWKKDAYVTMNYPVRGN